MTFGPPSGPPPQPQRPKYWLTSGPMLPQRRWQRSTRVPVIVATVAGVLLLVGIAVAALISGSVNKASFTARGAVMCSPSGTHLSHVEAGAPVEIYDETGDRLAKTTLGPPHIKGGTCAMVFTADDVGAGHGDYVVRIGEYFQQTVSESALTSGAVLRPIG